MIFGGSFSSLFHPCGVVLGWFRGPVIVVVVGWLVVVVVGWTIVSAW
jgi:hypothetical protein